MNIRQSIQNTASQLHALPTWLRALLFAQSLIPAAVFVLQVKYLGYKATEMGMTLKMVAGPQGQPNADQQALAHAYGNILVQAGQPASHLFFWMWVVNAVLAVSGLVLFILLTTKPKAPVPCEC